MEELKKQKIIKAVVDYKTPIKDIASRLYITERQLKLLLESWGVELARKRRYTKMPVPERQGLMTLYKKYGNTQKVAEHFNVGINTVNRWMKDLKIPTKKMKLNKEEKLTFLEEHLDRLNNINL